MASAQADGLETSGQSEQAAGRWSASHHEGKGTSGLTCVAVAAAAAEVNLIRGPIPEPRDHQPIEGGIGRAGVGTSVSFPEGEKGEF